MAFGRCLHILLDELVLCTSRQRRLPAVCIGNLWFLSMEQNDRTLPRQSYKLRLERWVRGAGAYIYRQHLQPKKKRKIKKGEEKYNRLLAGRCVFFFFLSWILRVSPSLVDFPEKGWTSWFRGHRERPGTPRGRFLDIFHTSIQLDLKKGAARRERRRRCPNFSQSADTVPVSITYFHSFSCYFFPPWRTLSLVIIFFFFNYTQRQKKCVAQLKKEKNIYL